MINQFKINGKSALSIVVVVCLLILTFSLQANNVIGYRILDTEAVRTDTTPINIRQSRLIKGSDTIITKRDTTKNRKDSVQTIDTVKISKDSLDVPVQYAAEDSGVLIISSKEFRLYGKAETNYKDIQLKAATIQYDQESQTVRASGSRDSSGNPNSKPEMTQGGSKSISDSIAFNMKTGIGLTKNTYYQEGELFINAQLLKKVDSNSFYGKGAKFTTCNLDTPHFAFRSGKIKLINNKYAYSGPANPEFEGVPMPVGVPFGIFPMTRGRSSGLLAPQFTTSEDFGVGLEGLGFYKVLNDNVDVTIRTNLYSYGGWALNVSPKYLKRYRYQGSMNITVQQTKVLNRVISKDEFSKSRTFMINWSHSRDSRARPGTSFSANVNFGSTRFNQFLLNNNLQNVQNQLSSSISYTKDFRGKANLSLNANHNQNNNSKLVTLSLPNMNFNVVTFYPFQKKERIGSEKWYEKLGIGISTNFQNQINFFDTALSQKGGLLRYFLDTLQWGATHNIPITLSLPSLGPITVAPSIGYQERWYGQSIFRNWNNVTKRVDTTVRRGFAAARDMSFGISASTRIFGTVEFRKSKKIQAIRHEIRPSIGINYKPDMMARFYKDLQIDTTGRTIRASQFDGGLIGAFAEGRNGGISFGVDNLLEMKLRPKDSTEKARKVKLIDGFGFSGSYNFLADSFKLSTISLYVRSNLFEKINITAGATLDPYETDTKGFRKNSLLWNAARFKPGVITGGQIAISTQFQSKTKDGKEAEDKSIPVDPFMTPDEQQRQLQFARSNPAEFTDFNIPWTLSLSYSFTFNRAIKADYSGFETITNSGLSFNGDFSISPKWKVGANGFVDVSNLKINQFSMFLTREMHCWQMSINVTPIGAWRSFNITINPKSGILRDLRINRSRTFSNSSF